MRNLEQLKTLQSLVCKDTPMNTNKLNQKIASIEAELAEMKALLNKPVQAINYWQPDVVNFEKYFYVNQVGDIKHDCANDKAVKRYRVFKTEEEAKRYAEYIKAEEILRKAIAEANEGWLPNWTSNSNINHLIVLNNNKLTLQTHCQIKHLPSYMYLNSKEKAQILINTYEKELRTYLSY